MQASQTSSGQLEDRLRNLILSNTDQAAANPLQTSVVPPPTKSKQPVDQSIVRENWKKGEQPSIPAQAPAKTGKKRPNQAQRRQMQAQLSIPIDTRASAPNDRRAHVAPHQYDNQRTAWHNTEQNGQDPPHISTYRSGSRDRAATAGNHPFSQQHRQRSGLGRAPISPPDHQSSWRQQQPNASHVFSKGVNVVSPDAFPSRTPQPSQPALYNPGGQRQFVFSAEQLANQSELLDMLCRSVIIGAEIEPNEIAEKENFRAQVETICRDVITRHEIHTNRAIGFQPYTVQLKCFGSLSSGFATKASDMDLGLLSPMSQSSPDSSESPIPRLIEKALLAHGFGARLLTRTRVPIIKLCEKPNEQLRLGLLEARTKWENGLADDGQEAIEDNIDEQEAPEGPTPITTTGLEHSPLRTQRRDSNQPSDRVEKTYEEQLSSLKQSETQSLMAYYGNAKRLLRRLNGREITVSNIADFMFTDYKLLDDVSGAFVNGLYDRNLRSRVQSYPSFRSDIMSETHNFRSLYGVLTMVEGETLVTIWESQATDEGNSRLRQISENHIRSWKNLQVKRKFGTDPLLFNRELHAALERLRQIPLIQLEQLKQDQYESPTQYHIRVNKIAADLGSFGPSSNTSLLPRVIQHYISGIRDKDIREEVQDFATVYKVQALRTIARKHKVADLINDYRRAMEKGFYYDEDIPAIKEYIEILQQGFIQQTQPPNKGITNTFDFIVPVSGNTIPIVKKIRQLSDPSKLAPNQPRDRYHDSLEFPKNGIGVQCDINFSAHLALQNTLLLRCYSYSDVRVRPMVLFVKHWAKARDINTPYRGTLSSYGYVLMVLHYLINIAEPFVCPNLQQLAPPDPNLPAEALEGLTTCQGHNVRFWRDEQEIQRLASQGHLNQNQESIGSLLRGFFEYYAQNNTMSTTHKRGFDWGRDVISLRTHGGLLSKQDKGWTGAKTVIQEAGAPSVSTETEANTNVTSPTDRATQSQSGQPMSPEGVSTTRKPKEVKEVRHRFLFAIEDPFELEHNVARTVTHNGIVSIRDEFRRAWRIIRSAGKTGRATEDLLEDAKVENEKKDKVQFTELLEEIHGVRIFTD
ncbi:hypothetical protein F5Y04DRAFT_253661 [Hypomontagnella monticulosa]|nr:hypothetical protein F5Y04DRAFT_253661 [Hypomontagnella monticulosa]